MGRNAQRRRAARAAQRQPVQSQPVLFYDVELWHLDDEPELVGAENRVTGPDQHLSAGWPSPSPSRATQHDRLAWPSDLST